MKRLIKPILVLLLLSYIFLVGCNGKDSIPNYINKSMEKIEIEYDGYDFVECDVEESMINSKFSISDFIDGKEININLFENGYKINYNNKEIVINEEFMFEKSKAYKNICTIWNSKSKIRYFIIFDDKLFVVTGNNRPLIGLQGTYPSAVFYIDIQSENIYYVGYDKHWEESGAKKLVKI